MCCYSDIPSALKKLLLVMTSSLVFCPPYTASGKSAHLARLARGYPLAVSAR